MKLLVDSAQSAFKVELDQQRERLGAEVCKVRIVVEIHGQQGVGQNADHADTELGL